MEEEEHSILLGLGGNVQDSKKYETDFVRRAELTLAPQLDAHGGIFRDSLQALGPSGNILSDVVQFRTMLKKIRGELSKLRHDESQQAQVLRIKEQLVLSYLEKVANVRELPIQEEIATERKRKTRLRRSEDVAAKDEDDVTSMEKPRHTNGSSGPQRLELLKLGGHLARSVASKSSSGRKAITDQAASRKRARTSIMARRKVPIEDDDDDEFQTDVLRRKRKEREKRRRERRALLINDKDEEESDEAEFDDDQKMPASDSNKASVQQEWEPEDNREKRRGDRRRSRSVKKEYERDEGESDADKKMPAFDFNRSSVKQHDVKQEMVSDADEISPRDDGSDRYWNDGTDGVAPPVDEERSSVTCPLCNTEIAFDINDDADGVLSKHIDGCQRQGRRSRRSGASKDYFDAGDDVAAQNRSSRTRKSSGKKRRVVPAQPQSSPPSLDDLEEHVYEDRVDVWIKSGLSKMRDMAERDQTEVPPGAAEYGNLFVPAWINDRLFGYQRTGMRWLWELHTQQVGGLVGDEMGLGKYVCAFLGSMAASRKLKSVLVICPATVLQHWLKELAVWAPGMRRVLIHKSGETDGHSRNVTRKLVRGMDKWLRRSRSERLYEAIDDTDLQNFPEEAFTGTSYVFVTTYENIRRSPEVWTAHDWSYCVLDEGQKIKNPDADVTLSVKRLRTPHRLLLSGTPIQNDLKELWSLFDFIFPGRLGTLPAFETEFAEPIRRGGYSNASPMQVQLAFRCSLVLKDLINPYLLRRQKKDIKEVARMPDKTEKVLFCRLSKRQRSLYEAYLRSDEITCVLRGTSQLFRAITTLRKISNHPDLVCEPSEAALESFVKNGFNQVLQIEYSDEEDDDPTLNDAESLIERSGKLAVLAKILPLWKKQGHRVLIFCQWKKMLNLLQGFVMAQGWKFGRMDGNTSVASRQRLVDNFNEDESIFAMLMTTRTGGVGLNLTGADRVVLYDPDFNPQTDSQARARSHRFGQTKPVTIYRLITAGTIEEKIYQRQIFKTALTNRVLQDPKQKRLFSQRDLKDLFTLKADDGSVINGAAGVTQLGVLTKGEGVVHPDQVRQGANDDDENAAEDKETLEDVMKSKGLAGVFDHHAVDSSESTKKKSATAREMEARAKQVARESLRTLEASSAAFNQFEPTWTGSESTSIPSGRFGNGAERIRNYSSSASNAGSAIGIGLSQRSSGPALNSTNLLAGLKRMQAPEGEDTSSYAALLKRIVQYIKRFGGHRPGGGPTTDEVLRYFDDVPNNEAAIFRRLLNSVAKVEKGRWSLKK